MPLPSFLRYREPNKLASTNVTNEIVAAVTNDYAVPHLGTENARLPRLTLTVQIHRRAQGAGQYHIKVATPVAGKDNTKPLVLADLGLTEDCIVGTAWNPADVGTGGWTLADGQILTGYLIDADAEGRVTVMLGGGAGGDTFPKPKYKGQVFQGLGQGDPGVYGWSFLIGGSLPPG
jgi:hypothetical protein